EAEGYRGLLDRQRGKIAQFHYLRGHGFLPSQPLQGFIQSQEELGSLLVDDIEPIQSEALASAAMAAAAFAPRPLDADAPERFSRSSKEVAATLPGLRFVFIHEPKVGLVHQSSSIERLARLFTGQPLPGELAQLVINQRQELLGGLGVPLLDGRQN